MRTRRYRAGNEATVDPVVFVIGDGTVRFFDERVYATRAAAERAWQACRRTAWAMCRRLQPPSAALVYDGLTRAGFEALWRRLPWQIFDAACVRAVRRAVAADRAAVAAFREADPTGAAEIADYLAMWLGDLDAIAQAAELRGEVDGFTRAQHALLSRMCGRFGHEELT